MKKYFPLLILIAFIFNACKDDDDINNGGLNAESKMPNPSFEGTPLEGQLNGQMPDGLINCGFPGETTPDIHPVENGSFGVTQSPYHGDTYIGMVVRDNDTWERIGIELEGRLTKDKKYDFSIYLCRSETYESGGTLNINYTTPCKLRIWGGHSICGRDELLGETETVTHTDWKEYKFDIMPQENTAYVILEAFYQTTTVFPYNGNILLDNASGFIEK